MDPVDSITAYHQVSKHHFHRPAAGPGRMDWANQPDPFRRYQSAPILPLERVPPLDTPRFEATFLEGMIEPAAVDRHSISQFLFDSLALSAWKRLGSTTWPLRVNPSSGNLHPTEGYLLCGAVEGFCDNPMLAHYAPREHALELRAELPAALWRRLILKSPPQILFMGLTSIHWREAWKYGERAFRYCQHDVGHAIATISVAAAALGWRVRLLDGWSTDQLTALLGIAHPKATDAETADCLLAIEPQAGIVERRGPANLSDWPEPARWYGKPNRLSAESVQWPELAKAERACHKPLTSGRYPKEPPALPELPVGKAGFGIRPIVHRRRSAVDMDGRSAISRDAFYQILRKCLPGPRQVPFTALPWTPQVHLVFFVHRVQDLDPGLYLLLRDPSAESVLQAALKPGFAWERPSECPDGMKLYRLAIGDARELSQQLSCTQAIAGNGCFSVAMLSRFEPALRENGAWFYPRLFWECGMIGQQLYLEAYANDVAATGIGCYFDDPVHDTLGLEGLDWQVLYHFTVGAAVEDARLTTLPPYPGP
ncbi:SagB/ThcOx family dehydrogenase [Thiohalomonas denitrificans]|uniref:SagB-type dehydrogenase domain-containing protein n=1 Tax=Thiohalomonas denitrificans TaxID=415747 RepID=A0A1G5QX27_9GAMM|nr:SagB/ThcOx family dehydrogenase [Thiohalomonas denitrificans]SCZ66434.1 SagB-type dehydrogenase domain-containing protein [Thiohalomonas denitrificans]